jgi:glycine cleavage system regulatory protein
MTTSLVLTIIGDDRPGLVERVSDVVAGHGGNWIESRLAKLAGKFAGVLRVNVADEQADALQRALGALADEGLSVVIEPTEPTDEPPAWTLTLELIGHDQPGIVRQVSGALASRGINVVELTTECFNAPWSGEAMFKARAKLAAPRETNVDALHDELDRISQDLHVDITLQPQSS